MFKTFTKAAALTVLVFHVTSVRAADPCAPAQVYGASLISLIGQMAQRQQRTQDCLAERQAQWAEYHARQKAASDKAAADAAQQKQAADAKAAAALAATAQHARAAAQAVVAEARVRHRHEQARAESAKIHEQARVDSLKDQQVAEARRRDAYVRLVRDENAPDNICHDPKVARTVMEGWNGLDTMKEAAVRVIDIEHMTTVSRGSGDQGVSCHGVFVTNRGGRLAGTGTVRRNIAGDPMFVWERDADQDLARYAAPAGVEVKVAAPMVREVSAKGPAI